METSRNFDNQQIIISEGKTTDGCYLILTGLAQSFTCNNQAGIEYLLGNLGPYELFGEFAVIDSLPITVTVRSIAPIECLFIPKQHFIDVLDSHHQLARNLLNTMVAKYRSLIQCSNFG